MTEGQIEVFSLYESREAYLKARQQYDGILIFKERKDGSIGGEKHIAPPKKRSKIAENGTIHRQN